MAEIIDFNKILNQELEKLHNDGFIINAASAQLKKLITEIFSNLFTTYSKNGKAIQEFIESKLELHLDKIDMSSYNQAILVIISESLEKTSLSNAKELIERRVNKITGVLDKKEWLLSEIIEKFIEEEVKNGADDDAEGEIYVSVEKSKYGSIYISINESEVNRHYDAKYRLSIDTKDNRLWMLEISGKSANIIQDPFKLTHAFESFLFKLYAAEVTITIDDYDTEWSKYRD